MSADFNDIIRQGYVRFKGKVGTWNKRWIVLRRASSKGPQRIEKYRDENESIVTTAETPCLDKCMLLTDASSIARVSNDVKKHALSVTFIGAAPTRVFACDSESAANDWVRELQLVSEMSMADSATRSVDLLQMVPDQGLPAHRFYVYLCPTPTLSRYGECVFNVSSEEVFLTDINNPPDRLAAWPLNSLRRYGRDECKFTFESGRRCPTGEGLFVFNTIQGEEIYCKVHSATVSISEVKKVMQNPFIRSASQPLPPTPGAEGGAPAKSSSLKKKRSSEKARGGAAAAEDTRPPMPVPRSPLERPLPAIPPTADAGEYDAISLKARQPAMPPGASVASARNIPLPPTPEENNNETTFTPHHAAETNDEDPAEDYEDDYPYEEKGLAPQFRRFLKDRKDDEGDDD